MTSAWGSSSKASCHPTSGAHELTLLLAYFAKLGLPQEEAARLHKVRPRTFAPCNCSFRAQHYYTEYGLAIRGLVKHHQVDALDYDLACDQALPLESILAPNLPLRELLSNIDRTKYRVWALTNAYVHVRTSPAHLSKLTKRPQHATRVLRLLNLSDQFEGVVSCDYTVPSFSCKPELAFYREAQLAAGQPVPEKNSFIDDSYTNVVGSFLAGWGRSVLFDELGDAEKKLWDLLEESRPNGVKNVVNGTAGQGKVKVVRDILELRTLWSDVFRQPTTNGSNGM